MTQRDIDVSILIVSYNTIELTCACIQSILDQTHAVKYEIIVVDNGSTDGSVEMLKQRFPACILLCQDRNLGFARATNIAAQHASGTYLLLLNSDTVVLDEAIDRLHAFALKKPESGIWGGRTVFDDGSLNPTSCWNRQTPWSLLCRASYLSAAFRSSRLFNPEAIGGWRRDSQRNVDIVTGCFFLISAQLWKQLIGFDPHFFMYGEEADLCLRARELGVTPRITPDATIIHHGGRSETAQADKLTRLLTSRIALTNRHWRIYWRWWGRAMHWLWMLRNLLIWRIFAFLHIASAADRSACYRTVWHRRKQWLSGIHSELHTDEDQCTHD